MGSAFRRLHRIDADMQRTECTVSFKYVPIFRSTSDGDVRRTFHVNRCLCIEIVSHFVHRHGLHVKMRRFFEANKTTRNNIVTRTHEMYEIEKISPGMRVLVSVCPTS